MRCVGVVWVSEVTRSAESLMPLALAPVIRLVMAEKRPVLSGVLSCVRCVQKNTRKRNKKGAQKRWEHGDNSEGKYKKCRHIW